LAFGRQQLGFNHRGHGGNRRRFAQASA
jgi:hypothetical protein